MRMSCPALEPNQDDQALAVKRLGLGEAAGSLVEIGEVAEIDGELGVLGAERLLGDR